MSFIDNYLNKHVLDNVPQKTKDNLDALEKQIQDTVESNKGNFEDILKKYGPSLSDLVSRVSAGISSAKFSTTTIRWVINIAVEVYQLVDQMFDSEFSTVGMTDVQKHDAKVSFGKDLTYFIWMTIDPLSKYLGWLPFRKTVEKWLVRWIAGYGLEATVDLMDANKYVTALNVAIINPVSPRLKAVR